MDFAEVAARSCLVLAFFAGLYYNDKNMSCRRDTVKKLFLALGLCIVLLAAGCGKQTKYTEPTYYKVTFTMRGHTCSEQTVEAGHLPKSVRTNIPGLCFVRWCDEAGQPANPFTSFVTGDVRYVAEAYPELTNHVPYLFLDEEGYLRPDDPLTADELAAALEALATEGAKNYFPGMPIGNQRITVQILIGILDDFFPEQELEEQFQGAGEETVTRTCFAQGMQKLLRRENTEVLSMDSAAVIANDITQDREDTVVLLEASVRHTPVRGGHRWSKVQLPVRYSPGFVNIDGWLYYVQRDYKLLKNDYMGSFYFGEDGRYTSGDGKLDQQVAQLLEKLSKDNPGADRYTLLRAAYDHCCTYEFHEKLDMEYGHTGWETEEALLMFLDGKGDSYNYAAAFWALARGLGYDAKVVSGTFGIYHIPHGWVIITIDEKDYFFDPASQLENPKHDMFMFSDQKIDEWNYKWES